MKKLLALLMSMMLVAALLVGCSSGGTEEAAPAEEAEEVVEEAAEEPEAEAEEPAEEAAPALENNKVAMLYNSVVTDGGWNQTADEEMHKLAEQYGLDVSYKENVSDEEVMDLIRQYAADGYGLIVDAEQYHCEQIAEIAPEFPDTKFACLNGYVGKAPNFWSITGDMWQHVYIAGVMAGKVTESNKIGIITFSTDSDSALTMKSSLAAGAQSVNPDAEIIHMATGSFSDLQAGKECAAALVSQGCDIIYCNSGDCNETVMQYCIDNQVYTISAIVDRNAMDDTYVLGSAMMPPTSMLDDMVAAYVEGTFEGADAADVRGIASGVEEFRINPSILDKYDQEVWDAIDAAEQDVINEVVTKPEY